MYKVFVFTFDYKEVPAERKTGIIAVFADQAREILRRKYGEKLGLTLTNVKIVDSFSITNTEYYPVVPGKDAEKLNKDLEKRT